MGVASSRRARCSSIAVRIVAACACVRKPRSTRKSRCASEAREVVRGIAGVESAQRASRHQTLHVERSRTRPPLRPAMSRSTVRFCAATSAVTRVPALKCRFRSGSAMRSRICHANGATRRVASVAYTRGVGTPSARTRSITNDSTAIVVVQLRTILDADEDLVCVDGGDDVRWLPWPPPSRSVAGGTRSDASGDRVQVISVSWLGRRASPWPVPWNAAGRSHFQ